MGSTGWQKYSYDFDGKSIASQYLNFNFDYIELLYEQLSFFSIFFEVFSEENGGRTTKTPSRKLNKMLYNAVNMLTTSRIV